MTPANPAYSVNEIAHQLRDSHSRGIVTTIHSLERVREAARIVGLPYERILLFGQTSVMGHVTWRSFLGQRHAELTASRIDPSKYLAFICYSSGTTGLPKGVMISHRNIVSNIHQAQPLDFSQLQWNKDKVGNDLSPRYISANLGAVGGRHAANVSYLASQSPSMFRTSILTYL